MFCLNVQTVNSRYSTHIASVPKNYFPISENFMNGLRKIPVNQSKNNEFVGVNAVYLEEAYVLLTIDIISY